MKINEIIMEKHERILNELKMSPGRLQQEVDKLGVTPIVGVEIEFYIPSIEPDETPIDPDDDFYDIAKEIAGDNEPLYLDMMDEYENWEADQTDPDIEANFFNFMKEKGYENPTIGDVYDLYEIGQSEEDIWMNTAEEFGNYLRDHDFSVVVNNVHDSGSSRLENWNIEPDSSIRPSYMSGSQSGIELISPPMEYKESIAKIEQAFNLIRHADGDTNKSCGLHINVSLKDVDFSEIDVVKLLLFLGDYHILETFGREYNEFAQSSLNLARQALRQNQSGESFKVIKKLDDMKKYIERKALDNISSVVENEKHQSVHIKDGYIEFRSIGGYYMNRWDDIMATINRYVFALSIAANPNAYRKEYAKKLYKMIDAGNKNKDIIKAFVDYSTGAINRNNLINQLKATDAYLMKQLGIK